MLTPNMGYRIGISGFMRSRIAELKNYGEVDILFLGSSHAYRGFDTRIFSENGYKTFNLGSSSQTPVQTKMLIERYLDRLNPKLAIYEVYPASFASDGVESSLDIISSDANDMRTFSMALKINNIKTYNTLVYSLMCQTFGLNQGPLDPVDDGTDRYVSGGYVERKITHYQPARFEEKEIALNPLQLKAFAEIAQSLKDRNIELLLVYAPVPKTYYDCYTNNSYFDSLMISHAVYINFNETLALNDSLHFYDHHHLNQNGVAVFNRALIELLNRK
jgi:hypothetical protein